MKKDNAENRDIYTGVKQADIHTDREKNTQKYRRKFDKESKQKRFKEKRNCSIQLQ